MGRRTIKWSKRFITSRDKIAEWYLTEMGRLAVIKFLKDLYAAAESIADMPTIGILDEVCSTETRKYYSVMIHPKYRLVYRFTSRNIYIVGIRSNLRNTRFT